MNAITTLLIANKLRPSTEKPTKPKKKGGKK